VRTEAVVLRTADLEYDLPPELIATTPVDPRDSARLLVVRKAGSGPIEHRSVRDLPELLGPGDRLIFNTSRVLPARFRGLREGTGGQVEGLYLRDAGTVPLRWVALVEAKRAHAGMRVAVHSPEDRDSGVRLTLCERSADDPGAWVVEVEAPERATPDILNRVGVTPLPPYILRARRLAGAAEYRAEDRERYQTVYAATPGSVAAPTAGLHFTPELIQRLATRGVHRADVTLHVGIGTFRPVETEVVEHHPMHSEWCSMTERTRDLIQQTRAGGRRVVCVGTTTARTVESYGVACADGRAAPDSLRTRLLITPGYRWQWTDGLLTNFHLPRSTLMALVAAMLPGGTEQLKAVYREAMTHRYRFYSYGDAMLIL
jgi:S-adenosylmethionine:tRNA ribosyltransferase-isomerase